jgi:type IV secretory pathway protease TraF
VGAIVDFPIPSAARHYIQARAGQSADNWYILKPVVAGPGDTVDTTGPWLRINGRMIFAMPPDYDTAGRALPLWRDHRVLHADEFFVFSARIPNSFDSRCYGPITRAQIAAVRRPMITW